MNEETLKLIADRYMCSARFEDYIDWAFSCLEQGLDSKNIRILAGLQKAIEETEIEKYFSRSIADLGWEYPNEKDCLVQCAKRTAENILSKEIAPIDGCHLIYKTSLYLDHPPELISWLYLDDGLDPYDYRQFYDGYNSDEIDEIKWNAAIVREAEILLELRKSEPRQEPIVINEEVNNNSSSESLLGKLWRKIF